MAYGARSSKTLLISFLLTALVVGIVVAGFKYNLFKAPEAAFNGISGSHDALVNSQPQLDSNAQFLRDLHREKENSK